MRSSKRPVTRLGLALTAALLGLATLTAMATADPDPTDPSTPPTPTSSSAPSTPSEPPPSSEPPASSEPETPPSSPESKAALDDLKVSAAFDKPSYTVGEKITATVTVTNTAADPITTFGSFHWHADMITLVPDANPFMEFTLDAGASTSRVVTGAVGNPGLTTAKLYVQFGSVSDHREFAFPVSITQKTGHVSGTVYYDENGNGKFDRGEGVDGVALSFNSRLYTDNRRKSETNEAGAFSLDVPTGPYWVSGSLPGYVFDGKDVTVTESGVDGLLLEVKRPLNSVLTAAMEFTKDTYEKDETPIVRVTLTNKGKLPLNNIVATNCGFVTDSPYLTGKGDGWGDLAGAGVALPAGTTKVLAVTEPMPELAYDYGYVAVRCDFAQAGVDYGANPTASDEAAVPGQVADLTISVGNGGSNSDLSTLRAVVTAPGGTCPIVAQATLDANGKATLKGLPTGRYQLYIVPPNTKWRFKHGNSTIAEAVAHRNNLYAFVGWQVGEDNPDLALPPNCPGSGAGTTPPAPQGGSTPGLAQTGASLILPGLAGMVALVLGAAALVLTRRRPAR